MKKTIIITLTTDFATDLYAGQMKGVILSINPEARIIDLTHKIKNYNVLEGAFFISQVCPTFPSRTIHLVVVDPGVGSDRRAVIICTEKYYYIGPDNGIFHFIIEKEKIRQVAQITTESFSNSSFTFQGRDIFAPVAAYLSLGRRMEEFGQLIDKKLLEKLTVPEECILYIDEFGNIITSIKKEFSLGERLTVRYGRKKVEATFARTFSQVKEGDYVVLKGSSGYLEVDRNKASAAAALGARVGEKIHICKASS
ncbi:hypothetical protein DRJ04_06585 [Candidatus Aerophobetes bacterium]|uniref:SAM-dependent chlorinase/fluorinase n=1 Tax=Aerophobetes bacterium TaxID=2030807 RepID=A0A662DDG5_UNCAE|nr:MAG: hypothetical protein DRJ04_06585 [Candidatus Aerophobetes bacterium]